MSYRLVKKFYKRTFGKPLYVRYEVENKSFNYIYNGIDKPASGELMKKALLLKQPITEEQVAAKFRHSVIG